MFKTKGRLSLFFETSRERGGSDSLKKTFVCVDDSYLAVTPQLVVKKRWKYFNLKIQSS